MPHWLHEQLQLRRCTCRQHSKPDDRCPPDFHSTAVMNKWDVQFSDACLCGFRLHLHYVANHWRVCTLWKCMEKLHRLQCRSAASALTARQTGCQCSHCIPYAWQLLIWQRTTQMAPGDCLLLTQPDASCSHSPQSPQSNVTTH